MKFQLFGRLKKTKHEKTPERSLKPISEIPVDQVKDLSSRGISQGEIVNQLRSQGYTYSQINKAMNQVVRESATGPPSARMSQKPQEPPAGEDFERPYEYPQSVEYTGPSKEELGIPKREMGKEKSEEGQFLVPENTEELIEVMIAEKMIDVEDEFESVHNKLQELEKILFDLRDQVKELQIRKDEDEKKFLGKVDEMESYLENSQSRIGGLEKALQQVLPSLVENVRDLSGVVQDIKKREK